MRVAMYYNNRDIRLEELPTPEIGKGEILVKVMKSGICGSDVMEWYRIKKAPIVLGHEISGEVVKVGEGVDKFKVADRVFVGHHVPCNTCKYCLNGNQTVCHTLHTTNYDPGGFSEYIRVPAINVDRGTFVLPEEISHDEGAFVEPLACVIRGQRAARFEPGQSVLIIGSGISGLLHLLLAKAQGAGAIIATDINEYRLNKAKEFGANEIIHADDDVPQKVKSYLNGSLADLVIICAPALSAFEQALDSVDRGGTVLCFATTEPGINVPLKANDFWRNSITVLPSYANSPYDAEIAIKLLQMGRINIKPMITHRFGLKDTPSGFHTFINDLKAIKVIIEPHT